MNALASKRAALLRKLESMSRDSPEFMNECLKRNAIASQGASGGPLTFGCYDTNLRKWGPEPPSAASQGGTKFYHWGDTDYHESESQRVSDLKLESTTGTDKKTVTVPRDIS